MTGAKQEATDGGTLEMQARYVYDALSNRVEKDVWTSGVGLATTRFGYDRQNVWVDLNGSNLLQMRRFYLDGVDQIFARIDSGGNASWYLTDHLGSILDVINSANTTSDVVAYDAFGNIANETNASFGDRYKYTGREFDSETGLQYNRARTYDSLLGRWMAKDPLEFSAQDSNLYRYVHNNPLEKTDPFGQFEILQGTPAATEKEAVLGYLVSNSFGLPDWWRHSPPDTYCYALFPSYTSFLALFDLPKADSYSGGNQVELLSNLDNRGQIVGQINVSLINGKNPPLPPGKYFATVISETYLAIGGTGQANAWIVAPDMDTQKFSLSSNSPDGRSGFFPDSFTVPFAVAAGQLPPIQFFTYKPSLSFPAFGQDSEAYAIFKYGVLVDPAKAPGEDMV